MLHQDRERRPPREHCGETADISLLALANRDGTEDRAGHPPPKGKQAALIPWKEGVRSGFPSRPTREVARALLISEEVHRRPRAETA